MGVLVVLAESCAGVSVVGSQGPAMGDWHISKVYVSPMHFSRQGAATDRLVGVCGLPRCELPG